MHQREKFGRSLSTAKQSPIQLMTNLNVASCHFYSCCSRVSPATVVTAKPVTDAPEIDDVEKVSGQLVTNSESGPQPNSSEKVFNTTLMFSRKIPEVKIFFNFWYFAENHRKSCV